LLVFSPLVLSHKLLLLPHLQPLLPLSLLLLLLPPLLQPLLLLQPPLLLLLKPK
jgi:hypothetical protein